MYGEPETLSDTATYCNIASASETQSDINQAKLDSLEKKAVHLRLILEKDFKAADLKWSLFVAAALSFRHESCLKPFPPAFMKNGLKDMDELLSVITDVPALDLLLQQLDNLDNLPNIADIIDLLFYVMVRLKEPALKTVPVEEHESVLSLTQNFQQAPKPQCIFQVVSSLKSNAESKWKDLAKGHRVFYTCHGNRLENFYMLLNFGFQQHLTKNILVGSGVYMTPELNLSLPHSHGGFGWGSSCIGGHLSCVAMCEVIDAPEGINYQRPMFDEVQIQVESNSGDDIGIQYGYSVSYLGSGIRGDGPHDSDSKRVLTAAEAEPKNLQYLVTNCELIRVRYMLVYAKQPATMRFSTTGSNRNGGIRQWFSRHKLLSILLGYGLMLATIGFANNQPVNYYYKVLLKKLDFAYSNINV